jgi:hypothetical protein
MEAHMLEAIATTPLRNIFRFPFQAAKWQERFLLGALLIFAGSFVPIVPTIFVYGYILQITRQAIKGEDLTLPAWSDWNKFLLDGLRGTAVSLVYLLPGLLIFLGGAGIYSASMMAFPLMIGSAEHSGEGARVLPIVLMFFFSFGVLMLSMFLGTLLMFLGALPLPMATAHMITCDKLGAAFRVREWWKLLRVNWLGYGISFVIVAGLAMVLNAAIALLYYSVVLCCLVPFITAPIGFYLSLVSAATFGQTYRESVTLLESRNAMTPA